MNRPETVIEEITRRALERAMVERERLRREIDAATQTLMSLQADYERTEKVCTALEADAKRLGLDLSMLGKDLPIAKGAVPR